MRLLAAAHSLLRQRQIFSRAAPPARELFQSKRESPRPPRPSFAGYTPDRPGPRGYPPPDPAEYPQSPAWYGADNGKPRHRQHILGKRAVTRPEQRLMDECHKLRALPLAANLASHGRRAKRPRQASGASCACALTSTSVRSIFCTCAAPPSGSSVSIARAQPSPYSAGCSGKSQLSASAARQIPRQPIRIELRPVQAALDRCARQRRRAVLHQLGDARLLLSLERFRVFAKHRECFLCLGAGRIAARDIQAHGLCAPPPRCACDRTDDR